MALEYTFESSPRVGADELFDFFKQATGAEVVHLGAPFLRTAGMDVTPCAVDPDSPREREDFVPGAGFRCRVRAGFRMRNLASDYDRQEAYTAMLSSVLTFFLRHPGDGILLVNGERVVLSRYRDEVVFDTWEGLDEEPAMVAVMAGYPRRQLAQPFL